MRSSTVRSAIVPSPSSMPRAQAAQAAHRGSGGRHGAARRDGGDSLGAGLADAAARFDLECDSSAAAGDYSRAQLDHSVCERAADCGAAGGRAERSGRRAHCARTSWVAGRGAALGDRRAAQGRARFARCARRRRWSWASTWARSISSIQIEAPPSVASGMQRIGRAGHHVDAVSEGVLFPKYRADLVACAAVTRAMHEGHIESTRFPAQPAGRAGAAVGGDCGQCGESREPASRRSEGSEREISEQRAENWTRAISQFDDWDESSHANSANFVAPRTRSIRRFSLRSCARRRAVWRV